MIYNKKIELYQSKKIRAVTLKIKKKINLYQIKDFWLEIWYNEYVYNI